MSINFNRQLFSPVAKIGAVILALFQIYSTAGFGALEAPMQRGVHLALIMFIGFLWLPTFKKKDGDNSKESKGWVLLDIIFALIALAIAGYIIWDLEMFLNRLRYVDDVTTADMFFGTCCILLTLELTRRTAGMALVMVAVVSLIFAKVGPWLPGILNHEGVAFDRLIEQLFLLTDGIYGTPIAVAATMIYAFIMFGAALERTNMSSVFIDLACLLTKNSKGGPAKVAIFASALFGSISGSAPANVYGTGTFTIPLMKRAGYRPAFAGAVEAVASSGGQIMPPIMGAAAFIMADLTGAGYLAIATAAVLPALLYYLSLLVMIHFEADRYNLGKLPPRAGT